MGIFLSGPPYRFHSWPLEEPFIALSPTNDYFEALKRTVITTPNRSIVEVSHVLLKILLRTKGFLDGAQ